MPAIAVELAHDSSDNCVKSFVGKTAALYKAAHHHTPNLANHAFIPCTMHQMVEESSS